MNAKKIIKTAGNAVMLISLFYLLRKVFLYQDQIVPFLNGRLMAVFVTSSIIYALVVSCNAVVFIKLLELLWGEKPIDRLNCYLLYVKSNIYKYLPGNIMHYVGRNQIAVDNDIPHTTVFLTTGIEIVLTCLASLLIGFIFSFNYSKEWLLNNVGLRMIILTVSAGIVLVGTVIFVLKNRIRNHYQKIKASVTRKNIKVLLLAQMYYIVSNIVNSAMFLVLLLCLNVKVADSPSAVIGVYCFSWLIGFITPGAPGGLGIREAMLTLLLAGNVGAELIATAALINRMSTILGDLAAFIVSFAVKKVMNGRGKVL